MSRTSPYMDIVLGPSNSAGTAAPTDRQHSHTYRQPHTMRSGMPPTLSLQLPLPTPNRRLSESPSAAWLPHRMADQSPTLHCSAKVSGTRSPTSSMPVLCSSFNNFSVGSSERLPPVQAPGPDLFAPLRTTPTLPPLTSLQLPAAGNSHSAGLDTIIDDHATQVPIQVQRNDVPPDRSVANGLRRSRPLYKDVPPLLSLEDRLSVITTFIYELAAKAPSGTESQRIEEQLSAFMGRLREILLDAIELIREYLANGPTDSMPQGPSNWATQHDPEVAPLYRGLVEPLRSPFSSYRAWAYEVYGSEDNAIDHVCRVQRALLNAQRIYVDWKTRHTQAAMYAEAVQSIERGDPPLLGAQQDIARTINTAVLARSCRRCPAMTVTVGRDVPEDTRKRGTKRKRGQKLKYTAAEVAEQLLKWPGEREDPKWLADMRSKHQTRLPSNASAVNKRQKTASDPQPSSVASEHDNAELATTKRRGKGKRSILPPVTTTTAPETESLFAATSYQHPSRYSHRGKSKGSCGASAS